MDRILIVGATSAIAHAVARRFAAGGARLVLAGRRVEALEANAADLRTRGSPEVRVVVMDAADIGSHEAMVADAFTAWAGLDAALIAHGSLPDQSRAERSVADFLQGFDLNARSVLAMMTLLAERFDAQGSGCLAVLSSPAGDRGRASNYAYGSAKAAVSVFASGLRNRLHGRGVRVLTILPGFVDTPMTRSFKKGPLWASADRVAGDIEQAMRGGFGIVYTPWFWRWIMRLIRWLPERLFVRLKL